ncbi:MAG: hypothetical protein CL609_11150 [Anaerolineaceae bacterium]|nr:hypothetical protein [Anaerolineaceae bacterium]
MREILDEVNSWFKAGKQVALATVVKIYGSAPRGLGAKMAVNEDGAMVGSVSGGCVEGAVISEALDVLQKQEARLLHYGITNDMAFSVGLACGGEIEVFVEPLNQAVFEQIYADLKSQTMTALVKVIQGAAIGAAIQVYPQSKRGPEGVSYLGDFPADLVEPALKQVQTLFTNQQNARLETGEAELFYDVLPPEPKLVIIGAVHIAIPLVTFAKALGFQTIVVDPRKAFASEERFPHVDVLARVWPQEYLETQLPDEGTYVVTVSHDEKLDVPALTLACNSKAHYIGALGSKKTFAGYRQQILDNGVTEEAAARIHSPIGLDIGARGPEEIALAIIAEVVKTRTGK